MYRRGWVEEVRGLVEAGIGADAPAMNSLGYDVIGEAIRRGENPEATVDRVITLTHQYAKRQETFFRSVPDALWLDISRPKAVIRAKRLARDHLGL
jgi:tRNA dimethylallyltransferase